MNYAYPPQQGPAVTFNRMMLCFGALITIWSLQSVAHSQQQNSILNTGVALPTNANLSEPWTSFRNGGTSRISPSANLPIHWSPDKAIQWSTDLPGYGQSCPLVASNSVWVTAVSGDNKENNLLVCLDRSNGKVAWQVERPSTLPGPSNYMFSRAAPTPTVDSNAVYALFESGDLFAVDREGKLLWECDVKTEIGPVKSRHGLGSSAAQTPDLLLLNIEHDGPSYLIAIQKKDGKVAWKADRPSGSSWSSPIVVPTEKQPQVIVSSAGSVTSYDSATGKRLWMVDGLAGNSVPSPTFHDGQLFLGARQPEFGSAEKAALSNLCLNLDPNGGEPEIAWRSERCISDYASPVVCGDYVYLINQSGILGCLDRMSGKEIYRKRLGIKCWATPIVHSNHVYIFGKDGTTIVIKSGPEFELVNENSLWDKQNPPKPTSYVEHYPKNQHGGGHGSHGHSGDASKESAKPGSRMLAGMMRNDANGDGILSGDEIPGRLSAVMENIDLNANGSLEAGELKKMAESFAAKRKGSRDSSRDPIVYGVAADPNGLLIRTGTRLFCIQSPETEDN